MKKSFTLSEALITLAIIGVLAAILIPVISNVRPDKDRVAYKKALYSLQSAVSNAMDTTEYSMAANSAAYWKDTNLRGWEFCMAVADSLNLKGQPQCGKNPDGSFNTHFESSYENPNFITTDGIRYWGLENPFRDPDDPNYQLIYVDRNLSTHDLHVLDKKRPGHTKAGLKIKVRYDGKFDTEDTEAFQYENEMLENSLQVTAGNS